MKKSEQIEILKDAKKELGNWSCLCSTFISVLAKYFKIESYTLIGPIKKYIPSFNKDHIFELCSENDLPLPTGWFYWWDTNDEKTRLAVLDLLIKELEDETENSCKMVCNWIDIYYCININRWKA